MSKYKFKKGDKVRVIADSKGVIKIGSFGIVQENSNCPFVMFNKSCFTEKSPPHYTVKKDTYALEELELELVADKPKKQTPPRITLKKHEKIVAELKDELLRANEKVTEANFELSLANEQLDKVNDYNKYLNDNVDELVSEGKNRDTEITFLNSQIDVLKRAQNKHNGHMFLALIAVITWALIATVL